MRLDALEKVLVEEATPIGALLGWNVVAEHIEPAAHHLLVDAALHEPFAPLFGVAHAGRHRPLRIVVRERKAKAAILDRELHRGERTAARRHVVEKGGRHEMGMRVDDHD